MRHDTSVTKVDAEFAPVGAMGQRYLASGIHVAMRLWKDEQPTTAGVPTTHSRRDYETVGYVLGGRAVLEVEGQTVNLAPGDSYVVPRGALHRYTVLESFSAIEATAPPAFARGRDEQDVSDAAPSPRVGRSGEDD